MKKEILFLVLLVTIPVLCFGQTTNYGTGSGTLGLNSAYYGFNAGKTSTGNFNVFNGYAAGSTNSTGSNNAFSGASAGAYNTTGRSNVFNGSGAGNYNTSGSNNVFNGYGAGRSNSSGNVNVFEGVSSGMNNNGNGNVFIGAFTGVNNTSGNYNLFSGYQSGYQNSNGAHNVSLGALSGMVNSIGSYNVFLGSRAGGNTTGSSNVFLGYNTGYNALGSNNVFLGNSAGYNEAGSNRLYIDNTDTTTPLVYGMFDTKQLGINTVNIPTGYAFAVGGKIISEELKVQLRTAGAWPDHVFTKDYHLPTLKEVENHINQYGYLQNIPSAKEVKENGILLGDMNARLLQKIEELTLYSIQQEKQSIQLQKELEIQKEKNNSLELRLQKIEALLTNTQK
jgi:hypothetical protein